MAIADKISRCHLALAQAQAQARVAQVAQQNIRITLIIIDNFDHFESVKNTKETERLCTKQLASLVCLMDRVTHVQSLPKSKFLCPQG